ncbi:hypothetical protein LCGC14_1070910 [marine sediment metagenome]|uniref:Uncharacterized protein n=1 Tax=marine sediment metagenome TaxID=412755 RepID=A0A0F9N5G2_9ZZZZ
MEKENSNVILFQNENARIEMIYNQPLEHGTTYYFKASIHKNKKFSNFEIEPFEFYPKIEEYLGTSIAKEIWDTIRPEIIKILDIDLGNLVKTKVDFSKKVFKIFDYPKCALCKEPKELRSSHIISKFVLKWIKKTSKTGKMRDLDYKRTQDSLKFPLLCDDCEQRISKFENYFAEMIFHPTVNLNSNDVNYDEKLLKFIISVNWRVINTIPMLMKKSLKEVSPHLVECEKNWREYLNGIIDKPLSSHYLIHTVCALDHIKEIKKSWQFLTQRSIAHSFDNYNGVDFVWCQLPFYLMISPVNPLSIEGYDQCLIQEKGLYKEDCIINLEKFDFMRFLLSKIDYYNEEIQKSKLK